MKKDQWERRAAQMVRVQMELRGVSCVELSEKLAQLGVNASASALRNKLHRGSFGASFLLQVLSALEVTGAEVGKTFDLIFRP